MRIAVVGVGDFGSRLAARLIHAGHDVTLIARGKTLERLQTEGLTATPGGSTFQTAMHIDVVRVTDNPTAVGPVDVVLMCVKLYQLDDAMAVASPLLGPHTTVLGVQNGVTAADRLSARFGAARVVGVASATTLAIGAWPRGTNARTTALVQLFKEAGINAVAHDHVIEAIWEKFIVVCGGAVCALARQSGGAVAEVPALRQLATMAETEALALAQAKTLWPKPTTMWNGVRPPIRPGACPCCKISTQADRWNWTRGAAAPSRSGRNWAYPHPPTSPSTRV